MLLFGGTITVKSKLLFAIVAASVAFTAAPAAYAGKAKPHKAAHHKAHHVKGWKKCKGTFQYLKGGKCLDSRKKK
jgi:hypothetical protein